MITELQRNYEVSIWTLQDGFITVLQPANLEFKGRIQDPNMSLKDDGTLNFSFSVPMYLNKQIENPIWYTTRNGVLAASMRKLKVIFNKGILEDEAVFEFLITKVTETHDKGQLVCKVESESLAFHELGHYGVTISLSAEDYELDVENWEKSHSQDEPEPINNLQYWTEKAIAFTDWTYEIIMDWAAYDGTVVDYLNMTPAEKVQFNAERTAASKRRYDTVYEDDYVPNWNVVNGELVPDGIESYKEKCRQISLSGSNLYNITQKLAEEFGVYCKYKYEYDSDYHIIGKKIIYYNSFIQDKDGALDITYPYDTEKISRTMDGTDICTKLYVTKVEDDTAPTGYISIMSTAANPSGEDYILNFDYLHKIGTITEEQYAAVKPYEVKMRTLNSKMAELTELIADAELKLVEYQATEKVTAESIIKAQEQITNNEKLCSSVTDSTGFLHLKQATAKHVTLMPNNDIKSSNGNIYKINLTEKGIVDAAPVTYIDDNGVEHQNVMSYIKIFNSVGDIGNIAPYSTESYGQNETCPYHKVEGDLSYIKDDMGNIIGISGFKEEDGRGRYIIYSYAPKFYYESVNAKLRNRIQQDQTAHDQAIRDYDITNSNLTQWREELDMLLDEKNVEIKKFNTMMGPALREGQWNPEKYEDYGVKEEASLTNGGEIIPDNLTENITSDNSNVKILWDIKPFEGELLQYRLLGLDGHVEICPYILLPKTESEGKISIQELVDKNLLDKICFFYNPFTDRDDTWQSIHIGGEMQYAFKKHTDNTNRVILLLTNMDIATAQLINELPNNKKYFGVYGAELVAMSSERDSILDADMTQTRIKLYSVGADDGVTAIIEIDDSFIVDAYNKPTFTYPILYPRIEINSLSVKTSPTALRLSYQSEKFYFKFKHLYVYHNDRAVWVQCQLYSEQDAYGIKISPQYIHHDDVANGPWPTDGNRWYDPWENWANGVGGETGYMLRFDADAYKRRRRTFDIKLSAYKNGIEVCTRIVTVDLPLADGGSFLYTEDISAGLSMYSDYSVLIRDNKYYLSPKPRTILEHLITGYNLKYELSNADLQIYLDAREVSQTNAYPQASYDVAINALGRKINYTTYKLIGQIVNINDLDLKFENVQGYVSEVELKLDKPWEDSIKIQNYKNKFEDLFSTIIASSNLVQAKAGIYDRTVSLFNSDGTLKDEVIKTTLGKVNLQYAFNKGKLTISEENGIWAVSDDGVVAMSGGGIFTATEKDANGDWLWNTGIVPSGINASLINSGQLDTNMVRIFAGDNLRFQMNGDGLFAYRSRLDGSAILNQYVVHNSEGLFLRGPRNQEETSKDLINRVAIDWNGLTLKNWAGKTTLFADAEQGNLWLSGTVSAQGFKIVNTDEEWIGAQQGSSIDQYIASLLAERTSLLRSSMTYLFDQAGQVLQAAESSLSSLNNIHLANNSLLNDFYNQVKEGLVEQREIKLYSNSSVDLLAGDTSSNVSAISISPSKGVWIGSSKGINFYAGGITDNTVASGASVSIDANKIIMGVSNVNFGTAIELTPSTIVFAAGTTAAQNLINTSDANIASSNLSGVKIDKDGIYFATGSSSNRSYIGMNVDGIQIGLIGGNYRGSYIKLSKDGLDVGSGADLHINTNNVQIFTDNSNGYFVLGNNLLNGGTPYLTLSSSGLSVTGNITANSLTISSTAASNAGLATQNWVSNQHYVLDSSLTNYVKNDLSQAISYANSGLTNKYVEINQDGLRIMALKTENSITSQFDFEVHSGSMGFWHRTNIVATDSNWIPDLVYANGSLWIGEATNGWQINPTSISHGTISAPTSGSSGSMYLGTAGINVNNIIEIAADGTFWIKPSSSSSSSDYLFKVSKNTQAQRYELNVANDLLNSMFETGDNGKPWVLPPMYGGTGSTSGLISTSIYVKHSTSELPTTDVNNGSLGIICSENQQSTTTTITGSVGDFAINSEKGSQNSWFDGKNYYWNYSIISQLLPASNGNYLDPWNKTTVAPYYARVGGTSYTAALWVRINLSNLNNCHTVSGSFQYCGMPPQLVDGNGAQWANYYIVNSGIGNKIISGHSNIALANSAEHIISNVYTYTPNISGHTTTLSTFNFSIDTLNNTNLTNGMYYLVIWPTNEDNTIHFIKKSSIKINSISSTTSSVIGEMYLRTANKWYKLAEISGNSL